MSTDTTWPSAVEIVEVSPRDGLQDHPRAVPTQTKVELVRRAAAAGVRRIEVTSFARPEMPLVAAGRRTSRSPTGRDGHAAYLLPGPHQLRTTLDHGGTRSPRPCPLSVGNLKLHRRAPRRVHQRLTEEKP